MAGCNVQFVAVNAWNALDDQQKLLSRCGFPLLQDQANIDVWALQNGKKDDMYIYDREGRLHTFLPSGGLVVTNLSSAAGYGNLMNAILAVP